jgi:hypothetical protein
MMEETKIRELISSALDYSTDAFNVDDIIEGILSGQLQLFTGKDSLLVTQVVFFPQKKSVNILIGAGELNELISMVENVVAPQAKDIGCKDLTLVGRKGWLKVLKETNWKQKYIYLSKELSHG